jgi:hypothetical protein
LRKKREQEEAKSCLNFREFRRVFHNKANPSLASITEWQREKRYTFNSVKIQEARKVIE